MSLLRARARNIIDLHHITCGAASHLVNFGPRLVNVINHHGVPDKFRGSGRTHINLRQVVGRVQRIVRLTLRLELDNLGGSPVNIARFQRGFFLDEADVQRARTRPVNVPVAIRELLLVHLLGTMKLRNGT